jgi:uncharacterized repeat protein (TIGR01451 family)
LYNAGGGQAGCPVGVSTGCGAGGSGGVGWLDGEPGTDGVAGQGGAGGQGDGSPGGGGGGGYMGGGGGGGGALICTMGSCTDPGYGLGGGGGGGSSLVPAGGTVSIDTTGTPSITISYPEPAPPTAPAVSLDVVSIDFGMALVGTTSSSHTVTLTNSGTATLSVATASLGGTIAAEFATTSNGCVNTALAPGEQCQVVVAFRPTSMGSKAAVLRFSDDASDSPQDVTLAGFGATPTADISVRVSAAPGSAKLGRTVRYTITISNLGPATANHIVVDDTLPSQVTFISASGSLAVCTPPGGGGSVVSCTIASIASGASATIQILATVGASKTLMTNSVSVSASTSDPNPANNTATVTTKAR